MEPDYGREVAQLVDGALKRIWWEIPNHERAALRCPFKGDVLWTQLPLEQAAAEVIEANRQRTKMRRLKTPSPVSEAEITFLAALLFYGERPLLQFPVGRYDMDFLISDYRAAIEIDGARWHDPEKDAKRDAYVLEKHGVRTYRVAARDALRDPLWAVRYTCKAIVSDRSTRAA